MLRHLCKLQLRLHGSRLCDSTLNALAIGSEESCYYARLHQEAQQYVLVSKSSQRQQQIRPTWLSLLTILPARTEELSKAKNACSICVTSTYTRRHSNAIAESCHEDDRCLRAMEVLRGGIARASKPLELCNCENRLA